MYQKSKKLTALIMAAAVAIGGNGMTAKAYGENGISPYAYGHDSASGTLGSVSWKASLTVSGKVATGEMSANLPARVYVDVQIYGVTNENTADYKSDSGIGQYYAETTVSFDNHEIDQAFASCFLQPDRVAYLSAPQ